MQRAARTWILHRRRPPRATAAAQDGPEGGRRRDLIRPGRARLRHCHHEEAVEVRDLRQPDPLDAVDPVISASEHQTLGHAVEGARLCGRVRGPLRADTSLRNREAILRACRERSSPPRSPVGRVTVRARRSPRPWARVVRQRRADRRRAFGVFYPVAPGAARRPPPRASPLRRRRAGQRGSDQHRRDHLAPIAAPRLRHHHHHRPAPPPLARYAPPSRRRRRHPPRADLARAPGSSSAQVPRASRWRAVLRSSPAARSDRDAAR